MKPPSDAIWDTNMCRRVHGLHCEHENIRVADDITTVWNQFYEKFEIWHIPIVDFHAIYHQFVWITTYKYTNTSHTLYMIGLSIKSGVLWSFWKEIWNSAKKCEEMCNFGKIWCFRGTRSHERSKLSLIWRFQSKLLYDE